MIDLQGWMYWQSPEKSSILGKSTWKRRWVVLTPDAIFVYKSDKACITQFHANCLQEGSCAPSASYSLTNFEKCVILEPSKKSPSALSLVPNPNRDAALPHNRANANSSATLIRKARRQSVPSLLPLGNAVGPAPLTSPILFRSEPESSISIHEWQRSINDRIKTPFPPTEFYPYTPSPPPPVPKIPYGIVSMHPATSVAPSSNKNTVPTSTSHKSLSHSVASNLSAALSTVTSPSSRRKSRALSPADVKRVRETSQVSTTSSDSITPPATAGIQHSSFDEELQSSLNAEHLLEHALRFHHQRRNQPRPGAPPSLKSKASTISGTNSSQSSPTQQQSTPAIRLNATLPATRSSPTSPTDLSIASFETLIKELEEEEAERKRKQPPHPILVQTQPQPTKAIPIQNPLPTPPAESPLIAQPRPKWINALNEVKRRSTGSLLFSQPLTPTFPLDKENSVPFLVDRKSSVASIHQARRISITSFGSQHNDSKRNSGHEITFNFVDWSGAGRGGDGNSFATSEHRVSRELSALMARSDSIVSSGFRDFDESRRLSIYNFGRRGSVF